MRKACSSASGRSDTGIVFEPQMRMEVRFHLANGAGLERVNWMGDSSEQGMARSAGLMVNYVYALPEVEANHDRYFREHAVIASSRVEKLAKEIAL